MSILFDFYLKNTPLHCAKISKILEHSNYVESIDINSSLIKG